MFMSYHISVSLLKTFCKIHPGVPAKVCCSALLLGSVLAVEVLQNYNLVAGSVITIV